MNYILPILAVLLGFLLSVIIKPKKEKSEAFAGLQRGFLLSLTVFSLLPQIYNSSNVRETGVFIMLGILLQIFVEFFSKDTENSHIHFHRDPKRFPWPIFISLSLHAILEGFPLHDHNNLVYGIVVHKFPVAVILSTFFPESSLKARRVFIFLLLFSIIIPVIF